MKPYALSLYSPATNATQRFQASLTSNAEGWKRSIRSNGGFYQGSMSFHGKASDLQWCFENWLGYEVRERSAGVKSWEGMIAEMDLTVNGVTRRRSLDLMRNKVMTTFNTMAFTGDDFVNNRGFEDATAVGAPLDDFWAWGEGNGGNGSVRIAGAAHAGARCVQLNSDDDDITGFHDPPSTYIRQHIAVTPGAKYLVTVYSKGDGGTANPDHYAHGGQGAFGVYSPNAPTGWLLGSPQYVPTTAAWTTVPNTLEFIGPSDGEIFLFFIAPYWYDVGAGTSRTCYFDDASMLEEAQCVMQTEWAEAAQSIIKYGQSEEVIHLDSYPLATSEAYRDTYLAEHAWPWPRPVSAGAIGDTRLDVLVAGYIWTAQNMYVQAGDNLEHDLNTFITAMVGTVEGISWRHGGDVTGAGDCQFLSTGAIDPNALQVAQRTGIEERPWDVIQELVALGGAGGVQWHAWVDVGRKLHYRPIITTPRYYLHKDGIHDTMTGRSPVNPWLMRPAVIRDMTYRSGLAETGSFLTEQRDFYAEEIEMADGWDRAAVKTSLFSEAELLLKQAERGG